MILLCSSCGSTALAGLVGAMAAEANLVTVGLIRRHPVKPADQAVIAGASRC